MMQCLLSPVSGWGEWLLLVVNGALVGCGIFFLIGVWLMKVNKNA